MNSGHVIDSFGRYLRGKGVTMNSLSLSSFPGLFVGYYLDVQFDNLDLENDGDLLLYQYGTYDWGSDMFFTIDFVRQFCVMPDGELDPDIFQQHITFYFDPHAFENIQSFNVWSSKCSDVTEFELIIVTSTGFSAAASTESLKQEMFFEPV